jgi:hypothetical protein
VDREQKSADQRQAVAEPERQAAVQRYEPDAAKADEAAVILYLSGLFFIYEPV